MTDNRSKPHPSILQKLNQQLISTILCSRSGLYCYVILAKCACSTIKASLWDLEYSLGKYPEKAPIEAKYVHTFENTPYVNSIAANGKINPACFTFTLVRNPYTRVLSAYLDRIISKKDQRFNLQGDVTFEEFLYIISKDDPVDLDPHYRPQSLLSLVGFLNYDFIGKVENLSNDLRFALNKIGTDHIRILNRRPHATNAKLLLDKYYTQKAVDLVNTIFNNDFINFNYYVNDFERLAGEPLNSTYFSDQSGGLLYEYIELNRRNNENVLDRFEDLIVFAAKNKCPSVIIEASCQAISNIKDLQISTNLLKVLKVAIEIECNLPQFYHQLGFLLLRGGDPNGAIKVQQKAIALNPKVPQFHLQLSRALATRKEISGAIEAVKKAIGLDRTNPFFYNHLGSLLLQDNDFDGAIKVQQKAIALNPKVPQFHLQLSRALTMRKKYLRRLSRMKKSILDDDVLIPPEKLIIENRIGTTDYQRVVDDFKKVGEGITGRMIREGFIGPASHVLDVGCGLGRLARPLTKFLSSGEYRGIDATKPSIDWCQASYAKFPNFRFEFADVFNSYYNPHTKTRDFQYQFPFADCSFDFVWSTSLFTHMMIDGFENYLSEMSRVMKVGAQCWNTYLLLNEVSLECIKNLDAKSRIQLHYPVDGGLVRDKNDPGAQIGLFEDRVRTIHKKNGLEIQEPIRYGPWCGRKDNLMAGWQDIIVAAKV